MDNLEKVIWVIPILAVLDAASNFYALGVGNSSMSLAFYEDGFLASLFEEAGLINLYIFICLIAMFGIAYALWYIKRRLAPSKVVDKGVFLLLVVATCYIYMRLTVALIGNFLSPIIINSGRDWYLLSIVLYVSMVFTLGFQLWRYVLNWVKTNDKEQK